MTIPTINVGLRLKGHFKLTAIDSITGMVRELAEFDNLIVNQGLDFLGGALPAGSVTTVSCCIVGTGTTPEAPTDTTIQSFLAGTTGNGGIFPTSTFQTTTPPFYSLSTANWQFGVGVAAGNLTEIAMCNINTAHPTPSAGSQAFSRTLIRSGGVPVTITVLPTEILNVLYTVQMFINNVASTGTFTLNINGTPTSFSYSILPCQAGSPAWLFGDLTHGFVFSASNPFGQDRADAYQASTYTPSTVTGLPSGTTVGNTGQTLGTYIPGTFSQTFQYVWSPAIANYASGVGGLKWCSSPLIWQCAITPAIMKTNLQQLTMNFAVSWSN